MNTTTSNNNNNSSNNTSQQLDRFSAAVRSVSRGCLLGTAFGDAFGIPIECKTFDELQLLRKCWVDQVLHEHPQLAPFKDQLQRQHDNLRQLEEKYHQNTVAAMMSAAAAGAKINNNNEGGMDQKTSSDEAASSSSNSSQNNNNTNHNNYNNGNMRTTIHDDNLVCKNPGAPWEETR